MSLNNAPNINRCNSILAQIQLEETKYKDLLKELQISKNQLRVNEIFENSNFAREKLFQVRVKVFRTFQDLLNVLPEKVNSYELSSESLRNPAEDSNIFLVEVFVSRPFHNKLLAKEWILDFSISASGHKTTKSLTLQDRAANSITAVLAFPRRRANDEIVKVCLTSPSNWQRIELAEIQTDISYKFTTSDANFQSKPESAEEAIEKINQIYKESDDKSPTRELLSYKLLCELDGESFIAALARNSYASLDPAQIICNEGNRTAKIEINDQRVQLELDAGKKSLRIQAPGEELCQLKRYFTMVQGASLNDASGDRKKWQRKDFQHIQSVNTLKNARTKLIEALNYNRIDVHDLLNVYDVYNRFIDGCPL